MFISTGCSDFFETDNDTQLRGDDYVKEVGELYSGFLGIVTKMQAIGDKAIYLTDIRAELLEPTENTPSELYSLYNYDDDLKLIETVEKIHEYCSQDRNLNRKVEIHVRKIHEVLNTRGGQSPNNSKKKTLDMSCILPYKQMIVRPDGKTSLCCNDPYGKYTLADLNKMSLKEAWYSERYKAIRERLRKGRAGIKLCRYCDTLPGPKGY